MIRLAMRGLFARRGRTVMTALAVVLGVGMISAALTVSDTMLSAADSLSAAAYHGTDAVVGAPRAFNTDENPGDARRSPPRRSRPSAPCRRSASRSATSSTRRA